MTARRIDADVALEIEGRLIRGETPAQVERGMKREPGFAARIPTLRTIQRMARDLTEDLGSYDDGEWRLTPDNTLLTGKTLLWIMDASVRDGWRRPLRTREGRWCETIHLLVPELGPLTVRMLAYLYVTAEARGESTAWLDTALAVGPWRGATERTAYEKLGLPPLPFAATAAQAKR